MTVWFKSDELPPTPGHVVKVCGSGGEGQPAPGAMPVYKRYVAPGVWSVVSQHPLGALEEDMMGHAPSYWSAYDQMLLI